MPDRTTTASATSGSRASRTAAERFEHEDRVNPEPDDPAQRRPEVPRPGNKYAWAVGIVALMVIAVVFFTVSLPNKGAGVRGPQPGERLPAFAAPLATSNVDDDFDANVFPSSKDAKSAGKRLSACEVRTESVLNSCELRERPVGADHDRHRGDRLRAPGGPRRAHAQGVPAGELRRGHERPEAQRGRRRSSAAGAGGCRSAWTATAR